MATSKRPLVHDAQNNQVAPLAEGQVLPPDSIPVASGDDNLIKVTDTGLAAKMSELVSSDEGNQIEVRENKLYVAPLEVQVSADKDNLITTEVDGVAVKAETMVSDAGDNKLEVRDGKLYTGAVAAQSYISTDAANKLGLGVDGKLYVAAPDVQDPVISADAGNLVRAGADGGVYADANDLISNGDVNLLTIDATDKKLIVTKKSVLDHLDMLSFDTGNLLEQGTDGGLKLTADNLIAEGEQLIGVKDHRLSTEIGLVYDIVTGVVALTGLDDAVLAAAVIPTSTSALRGVQFVNGKPDADGEAVEGDYYVTLAFGMTEDDTWDGGEGLGFTTTKGVAKSGAFTYGMRVPLNPGVFPSQVSAIFMGQTEEQALSAGGNTFTFDDGSRLTLTWTSSDGKTIAFNAEFTPAIGIAEGAYLRFVWLLSDGSVEDMYVDVSDLIDVYTAGCGIDITAHEVSVVPGNGVACTDGRVTITPDPDGGLQVSVDGVAIKPDPDGGLATSADGIGVKCAADGALTADADGLSVVAEAESPLVVGAGGIDLSLIANGGLEVVDGGLGVKIDPAGGIETGANGVAAKVDPAGGLETGTAGVGIKVDPTDGLQVGTDGIGIRIPETGGLETSADGITVKHDESLDLTADGVGVDTDWLKDQIVSAVKDGETVAAGTGITATPTDTGVSVAVDTDWLNSQIDGRVEDGLVTAGTGVTVSTADGKATVGVDETWLNGKITGAVAAGDGVTVSTADNRATVTAKAGTGVTVNATGINVNETWLTDKVNGLIDSKVDAGSVAAGTGITVDTADGTATVGVDTAWLTEQLDTRVESGGFVTAGDGIDVTASEGKAEIAVDDTVVRTSGDQTIAGTKTFTSDIHFNKNLVSGDNHSSDVLAYASAVKGTTPESDDSATLTLYGKDASLTSGLSDMLGQFAVFAMADGSTGARMRAVQNVAAATNRAELSVTYPASGDPYATAPSTRATPDDNEIITYDFLQTYVANNAPKTSYLPLYFTADTTELHSFVPAGVTQVRYAAIEADGAGTSGLTITMARDIGSTSSMEVTDSNANCSEYANHSVMFSVSGISDQTEIAVMIEFN